MAAVSEVENVRGGQGRSNDAVVSSASQGVTRGGAIGDSVTAIVDGLAAIVRALLIAGSPDSDSGSSDSGARRNSDVAIAVANRAADGRDGRSFSANTSGGLGQTAVGGVASGGTNTTSRQEAAKGQTRGDVGSTVVSEGRRAVHSHLVAVI